MTPGATLCAGCRRPVLHAVYEVEHNGNVLKLHDHQCLTAALVEERPGPALQSDA